MTAGTGSGFSWAPQARLHALVGGWTVLVLLVLWAIYHRQATSFRSMLPGLAMGGVLALAGVVPPIVMNAGADPALVKRGESDLCLRAVAAPPGPVVDEA